MKKLIKNLAILTAVLVAMMIVINKTIQFFSNFREHLSADDGKYYNWKYGSIFYTKCGKGAPLLLIHDLDPAASAYEWHRVYKKMAASHTVYCIDLLGCGRSDKPNLTYTHSVFAQLVADFVREVIRGRASVVATGDSFSFVLMACKAEPDHFYRLICVTPTDLYELSKTPGRRHNLLKFFIGLPVLGTFLYNMKMSRQEIRRRFAGEYFYRPHLVSPEILRAAHQGAHLYDGKGRYLFASIKSHYTNVNVVSALKEIDNSICLIGGKEHPFVSLIIDDYRSFNSSIEEACVPNSVCFPQLECPYKFVDLLRIVLSSA